MKVWCVTDRETAQLRANGMLGVSVVVGDAVLMPGTSMEVPAHKIAEIQSAIRNGLLSTVAPPTRPNTVVEPVAQAVPVESVELAVIRQPEPAAEIPESDNTERNKRRR